MRWIVILFAIVCFSCPHNVLAQTDSYPRIQRLESEYFGQSFSDENIFVRLNRLEQRAFGSVFPSNTLSDRVEKLEEAMPRVGSRSVINEYNNDYSNQYPVITDMEMSVFGRNYDDENELVRLSRLEEQILGFRQSGSVSTRINKLLAATQRQNTFSLGGMNTFSQDYQSTYNDPYYSPYNNSYSPMSGVLNLLLNGLLNNLF